MRIKVVLLVTILFCSTIGLTLSSELVEYENKMSTSIGNMPKNIVESGDVGLYSSMKIDSMNNPHIAYYDADNGDLIYTKYDGWNWNKTTIDSGDDVGAHASLALDKFDKPHIAYYDTTNEDLKYAHFDGNQWNNTSVDSDGNVGTYASIDVSTNTNPHIAYRDESNTNLKYAYYNGSAWKNTTLDGNWSGVDNVGKYASIALDSGNWPHVAYYNETGGDLMYMYNDGTTWYRFTAYSINNVGQHADIALDSNDSPHFVHYNMQFQNLMYTKFDGLNWTTETVDSVGRVGEYCTIAVDSNDLPHIAYVDRDNGGAIKYGHRNQSWDLFGIDEEGEFISIDVDSRDRAHFSYYDLSDGDLRYLSHSGANVDQITNGITFQQTWGGIGLVLDSQNVPHIAYQNHSDGNNKVSYATLNVSATESLGSNVWVIETIDESLGAFAGSWLSIDLDSQDRPHVSYFSGDGTDGIKYAFRNDSGWHNQTVDDGIDRLGFFSSLKIDSTDNPQIVYSRLGGNHLRYAMYDGLTWHTENIGTTEGGDKKGLQLALSDADVPHICYLDQNLQRLGYATYSGSSWVKETDVISDDIEVDPSVGRGRYCDIEVDRFGTPHISFDYNAYTELGYVIKNGSTWDGWNLSVSSDDGNVVYTQLEFDSAENPCISYHNSDEPPNGRDVYLTCYNATSGKQVQRDSGHLDSNFYFTSTNWGRYLNLQLDSNDSAHMAFYDLSTGNVMYYTDNYYPIFDTDGDGIPDSEDNFPSNPSEISDYDGDGIGDNADNDDDNDGVIDLTDYCQFGIIGAGADFDGDGCKDSEDEDDDNDGFYDDIDDCPKGLIGIGGDIDSDGCHNAEDTDIDGDGILNGDDDFELDPTEDTDSDGDGVGDNGDEFPNDVNETIDSDGDGVGDNSDEFPNDANETTDSDGDGVGDNEDEYDYDANETADSDGDGIGDNSDAFPNDANESSDFDGDGIGDNIDGDVDGDNVSDDEDVFPADPSEWNDTDEDGIGDNSDAFPNDINESADSDGDMVGDNADVFPNDANESSDSDEDGIGDNADICPGGDDLLDTDKDMIPDYCDLLVDSDGDGFDDAIDAFPNDINEWVDSDGDGIGNNADAFPADSERSDPDPAEFVTNQPEHNDTGKEDKNSEKISWSEFMKENGKESTIAISSIGAIVLIGIIKIRFSSRKIKKLKQELEEVLESKSILERFDFDGDGEISDLEFEAYKVIRDKGRPPRRTSVQEDKSRNRNSEEKTSELYRYR